MPAVPTTPAAGAGVMASAVVLTTGNYVIKAVANYGEFGSGADFICGTLAVNVQNLTSVYIHLFQYPEFDDGVTTWLCRTGIEWRPVMNLAGNATDEIGLISGNWIPMSAPMLLLPGTPVVYKLCCAPFSMVSVEFRVPAGLDDPTHGQDRVLISITAGQ